MNVEDLLLELEQLTPSQKLLPIICIDYGGETLDIIGVSIDNTCIILEMD